VKIELDIDLDKHLASYRGTDFDGYSIEEPTTLADVVIREAARQIAESVKRAEIRDVYAVAQDAIRALVQEKVAAEVAEQLAKGVPYVAAGKSLHQRFPLSEAVETELASVLTDKRGNWDGRDSYGKPHETLVAFLVREAVTSKIKAGIAKAVTEGQEQVKAVLRKEASDILAETITRMAKR
jgi:hypothetical protein